MIKRTAPLITRREHVNILERNIGVGTFRYILDYFTLIVLLSVSLLITLQPEKNQYKRNTETQSI